MQNRSLTLIACESAFLFPDWQAVGQENGGEDLMEMTYE